MTPSVPRRSVPRAVAISVTVALLAAAAYFYIIWTFFEEYPAGGLSAPIAGVLFLVSLVLGLSGRAGRFAASPDFMLSFCFGFLGVEVLAVSVIEWGTMLAEYVVFGIFCGLVAISFLALRNLARRRFRWLARGSVGGFALASLLFLFLNRFPYGSPVSIAFFLVLYSGSFALAILLSSHSRTAFLTGCVAFAFIYFVFFVPIFPTPYGTYQVCGPSGCQTLTQYNSISYGLGRAGAVYAGGWYSFGYGISVG